MTLATTLLSQPVAAALAFANQVMLTASFMLTTYCQSCNQWDNVGGVYG